MAIRHRTPTAAVAVLAVLALLARPAPAQEAGEAAGGDDRFAAVPAPDPADVASVDAVIGAIYDAISGPAGERDWERFRSLFVPGAQLFMAIPESTGGASPVLLTLEEYVELAGAGFRERPFYERESGRHVDRFGNVAQAMSAYESRTAPDAEPFSRGVNSIQLVRFRDRWWVANLVWDVEREGNPIPEELAGS